MNLDKYNEKIETKQDIKRVKLDTIDSNKKYTVAWIGAGENKFGKSSYIDYYDGSLRYRSTLPGRLYDTIVAMTSDIEVMSGIENGQVEVKFTPIHTASGFNTFQVTFSEKQ